MRERSYAIIVIIGILIASAITVYGKPFGDKDSAKSKPAAVADSSKIKFHSKLEARRDYLVNLSKQTEQQFVGIQAQLQLVNELLSDSLLTDKKKDN